MTRAFLGALAVLVCVATAQAAVVTFDVVLDEDGVGTFNVYASASLGDNFGISGFQIEFDQTTVSTLTLLAPRATLSSARNDSVGFLLSQLPSAGNENKLGAGQDVAQPQQLIYGFGQTAGSLPPVLGGTVIQANYGAPLLVGSGQYIGAGPVVEEGFGKTEANVFMSQEAFIAPPQGVSPDVTDADVVVNIIPEPMSLAMLGVGGIALIRRRRSA